VRRLRRWRQPPVVVHLLVRVHGDDQSVRMVMAMPVWPGDSLAVPFHLPPVINSPREEFVVELREVVISAPPRAA